MIEATTPSEWRRRRDELYEEMDPHAIKALAVESLAFDPSSLRPRLPSVSCPVTVVVGENDHPFVDQAEELATEVASGNLVVIEGAYHSPQLTHPETWRNALADHLARYGT